jgi:RNA polymerase sigma-32 factor
MFDAEYNPRSSARNLEEMEIGTPEPEAEKKAPEQERGSDSLRRYYAEVRRYPLLTAEEERILSRRYREDKDDDALRRLISCNLRLVIKIALEDRSHRDQIMDLVQEGNAGLIRAAERFDPDRGVRFAAYAAWWIRAAILKSIVDNHRLVRIGTTAAQRRLFFQLQRVRARLAAEEGTYDSEKIAEKIGVRAEEVDEMARRLGWSEASLEAQVSQEGGRRIMDTIPSSAASADEKLADHDLQEILRREIESLSAKMGDRERMILEERLLSDEPRTLVAIGAHFGVSRERIRQIEQAILSRIRTRVTAALGDDAADLLPQKRRARRRSPEERPQAGEDFQESGDWAAA